jgi:hypothetical protein
MNRRTGMIISSAALVALAVFGSAAGAFAAKAKSTASTGTTRAPVAGLAAQTGTPPIGARDGRGPGGGVVEVVAKLTGESTSTVMTARQSGKSFTQIASAKNVTGAQIVELALHAPEAAMNSEVSDGLITQTEADARLAALKSHLAAEIAETALRGPGGGPDGGRGHGGPPPTGQQPAGGATSSPGTTGTNQ